MHSYAYHRLLFQQNVLQWWEYSISVFSNMIATCHMWLGMIAIWVVWMGKWIHKLCLILVNKKVKVKVLVSHIWLFVIPWILPLSMEFTRILEWVAICFSREIFLTQGSNPGSRALQEDSLPSELVEKH